MLHGFCPSGFLDTSNNTQQALNQLLTPALALYLLISCCCISCAPGTPSLQTATVHLRYSDSTGYRLLRNAKPFYVRGAAGAGHLEKLSRYGANTVRVYSSDSLGQILERAGRLDLAVVVDIPLPAYNHHVSGPTLTPLTDSVIAVVDRFRDHPALLFWMLGNEVFQHGYDADFLRQYNLLADAVRAHDPNHPVSTAVIPHQLLSLYTTWAGLHVDFVSLNMFGNLATFDRTRDLLTPIWRGPYLISEWSFNGPWEEQTTLWGAPLESPSTTKAQHLRDRYLTEVHRPKDHRMLGNLAFYWGAKYERTPTWFSLLSATGGSSEPAFALGNLWQGRSAPFPGPQVAYLLLDERGGQESIVLPAGTSVTAKVQYAGNPPPALTPRWEVRAEDWRGQGELGFGPAPIAGLFFRCDRDSTRLLTPDRPGPYRIYFHAESPDGFFSTANIPFYVVASDETE